MTAGVCVALADRSAEEIVAALRHRVDGEDDLTDLGVPTSLATALRQALTRKIDDWGTG